MLLRSKQSECYAAVMADEVSNVSRWKQLGVGVRNIQNDCAVERIVMYIPYSSVLGEDICFNLISIQQQLGMVPNACGAQS